MSEETLMEQLAELRLELHELRVQLHASARLIAQQLYGRLSFAEVAAIHAMSALLVSAKHSAVGYATDQNLCLALGLAAWDISKGLVDAAVTRDTPADPRVSRRPAQSAHAEEERGQV